MTLKFQEDLLRFLLQVREGRKYIDWLDTSIFDMLEYQTVFELLSKYRKKYNTQPSISSLLEYWDRATKKAKISVDVYNQIADTISKLYSPFNSDTSLIRETIVEQAQLKMAKELLEKYASKLKDGGVEIYRLMQKEMADIIRLGDQVADQAAHRGGLLLRDHNSTPVELIQGHPTYLKGLNKLTAAGGFYSPQLVIFMSSPKGFKTGVALSIGVEYMRDGLNVYYADCENGVMSVRNRARQALLRATLQELMSHEHDAVLEEMVGRLMVMGGDMEIDFFPAHTKSLADVDAELEYLRVEKGWIPHVIIYDYLDLFQAIDPSKRKEKRINIQHVYFDAINLNHKWGTFAFSLSQVSAKAVGKSVIVMTDFAEDFAKAMNCHAAFALCHTPEEEEANIMRILPVAQREGKQYQGHNQCVVHVDRERMLVEEITFEQACVYLAGAGVSLDTMTGSKDSRPKLKNVKDE